MTSTADACAAWLDLDGEIDRLTHRWQALETRLMARPATTDPMAPADDDPPEARQMAALDLAIGARLKLRGALLARLPALPVTAAEDAFGKLAVAARLLPPPDHAQAHALLVGALDALRALACPVCGAASPATGAP